MPDPKLSEKPGPDPDQYLHILVEQDGQIAAGLEAQESGPRHRPRMPAQAAQQLPRAHIPHLSGGIRQTYTRTVPIRGDEKLEIILAFNASKSG